MEQERGADPGLPVTDSGTRSVPGLDYARLFVSVPTPYLVLDPDLVVVEANDAYLAVTGRTREAILGRWLFDAFPPSPDALDEHGVPRIQVSVERARDTGQADTMPIHKYDIDVGSGLEERFWSLTTVPLLGDDGRARLLLHRAEDVTDYVRERDRQRSASARGEALQRRVEQVEADLYARAAELRTALAAEEAATRRLAGLAEVALQLAATSDLLELAEVVVGAGLAALGADGGAIAVRDPDDDDVLHVSITESLGEDVQRAYAEISLHTPLPAAHAARTGEVVLLTDRASHEAWEGMADVYEATGKTAWASLPLRTGGRLLGSLVASWEQERQFTPADLEVLQAFAAQCAQTLDRLQVQAAQARAQDASRRLSESLQRSLLTAPPEPDHLQIAVRYQPAAKEAQVGGDWYDAFLVPNGSTTVVIGDVTGHDRNAAAAMAQIRNVLRGVAQSVEQPPAAVLSALDRAMANLAVDALATAVLAQVVQDERQAALGLRELVWSNAGHPPPLLIEPDGTAVLLEADPDLLLGLLPDTARTDHRRELGPGSVVLLFTDGLVERRGEALDVGLERLRASASALASLPLEELCDVLLAGTDEEREDDVALVALRLHPEDRPRPPEAGPRRLPGRLHEVPGPS